MKLSNSSFWKNLKENIEAFHLRFLLELIGPELLSDKEKLLIEKYFGKDFIKENDICILDKIFKFGQIKAKTVGLNNIKYKEYLAYLKDKEIKFKNTTDFEELNNLKKQAYLDVLSREYKIEKDIKQNILNEESKGENIEKSIKNVATNLTKNFESWTNDLDSSVQYLSQSVLNRGIAKSIEDLNEDKTDPSVYFVVQPDACKYCKFLYLNSDGSPKVFKLSVLKSNGSNIGKKPFDWLPTLASLHVHCRCQLEYLPEGYIWNSKRKLFTPKTIYFK